MLLNTMLYRRFGMADGRNASGCLSIVAETARLAGVRLRLKDFDDNVCEYLATPGGHVFRSALSGERETRPEMLAALREAFNQWCRVTSL